MSTPSILVTGSSGLVGSEVVSYFANRRGAVHGIDNNMREYFFGAHGSTRWNQCRLERNHPNFQHHEVDVRDRNGILTLVGKLRPRAIVHTAAQPSHDHAAALPFDDFDTNAVGTFNLLEAARQYCPDSPFIYLSTNKVYGDSLNQLSLVEFETRWDYADDEWKRGIPETFPIDQSMHTLFGASKLAADVLVQEYGQYFNMPTCCLRGGCLTGPGHSGVELHGFLSYLVKCNLEGREYTVFGHQAKQVRDNMHALDVARFIANFIAEPRVGQVYNLGGGKANSVSMMEAIAKVEHMSGRPMNWVYKSEPRQGDHIVYYSDLRKTMEHYPNWAIQIDLDMLFQQIYEGWRQRLTN